MKNIIATLLITAALLTGSSVFASSASINTTINNTSVSGINTINIGSGSFRASRFAVRSHQQYMVRGTQVLIELEGDGDTDLDLYVYDSNGNLIGKRDGNTDYETMILNIYKSSYFTIKVVNRGDIYNDYNLSVETL